MSDHRDEWGETAEERQARILARDLAWMSYSEASARDGVPRSERDHVVFNDGYAAGRADYVQPPSVVSEEPDVTALRAARAETWDEAIATVFAWWSTPEGERPAAIVNPYGVGMPAEQENES